MCKCAPALLTLRRQFDTTWPARDRSSDGCCGDAAHAARVSDHNPVGGYAHAHDFDEDIAPGLGNAPLLFLVPLLLADDRAKFVIYERRIYYARCNGHGAGCFAAGGHPYSGVNAHEHHLHLSIRADATHDTRPWHLIAPPNTTPPDEEDDMVDPEVKKLLTNIADRLANIEDIVARWGRKNGYDRTPPPIPERSETLKVLDAILDATQENA